MVTAFQERRDFLFGALSDIPGVKLEVNARRRASRLQPLQMIVCLCDVVDESGRGATWC